METNFKIKYETFLGGLSRPLCIVQDNYPYRKVTIIIRYGWIENKENAGPYAVGRWNIKYKS